MSKLLTKDEKDLITKYWRDTAFTKRWGITMQDVIEDLETGNGGTVQQAIMRIGVARGAQVKRVDGGIYVE